MPRHPSAPQTHFPRGTSRTAPRTVPSSPCPSPSPRASTPRACAGFRMRCVSLRSSLCAQARRISAMKRSASCFNGVEWNGMGCNTGTCFTGTGIYIIINTIPFHSLETLPVSVGSSQRFAVDLLLVDRVTATGEDARSPGQGVAHAYPRGQHGATPQPAPFNPQGYSGPDPRGCVPRTPIKLYQ